MLFQTYETSLSISERMETETAEDRQIFLNGFANLFIGSFKVIKTA